MNSQNSFSKSGIARWFVTPKPFWEVGLFATIVGSALLALAPIAQAQSPGGSKSPDTPIRTNELHQVEGVVHSADGKPLAGARIRVMAAKAPGALDSDSDASDPTVSTGAEADEAGHFLLPPMPIERVYRLQAFADGFKAGITRATNSQSAPVEFRLQPASGDGNQGKFAIHGRVLGPDKQPLPFAMVEPDGVGKGGGTSWGGSHNFPEQVLAGKDGQFTVAREEAFDRLQLRFNAPGMAPLMTWLTPTNAVQPVELNAGTRLTGRVVKDGQPLAGVLIGVSGKDRNSEVWQGHFETRTGSNGVFEFQHLPPATMWDLFGKMSSLKNFGALAPRPQKSGGPGESTDLGDLTVNPGKHLAGKMQTRNGEPLPKGVRVILSYENAWDSQTVPVDEAGHFRFDGLAATTATLSFNQRGWRLASANRSTDVLNDFRLIGLIEDNKDDLLLLIERGERPSNSYWNGNGQLPPQDQPQGRPLSGAEPNGPAPIVIAGQVLDDKTGNPILACTVVPGYQPPKYGAPPPQRPMLQRLLNPSPPRVVPWNERIYWQYSQTESVTNGAFSLDFLPLTSQPVLRVEAPGYQPYKSPPMLQPPTNLVIRLKRGAGPNGIVFLPDGKPAFKATLIFAGNQEQVSLSSYTLDAYGKREIVASTAANGAFSFPARSEATELFVAHQSGWAQLFVKSDGADNLRIHLRPWASVVGTLVDSNGVPSVGTELELSPYHDQRGAPTIVNLQEKVTTDAQGRFSFTVVPPARLELQRTIKMGPNGGYTLQRQSWFVAQPGITNNLGKVEFDHPPPPPPLDQLKTRLGL